MAAARYAVLLSVQELIAYAKANPNKIIAEATDWRFLKELKKELKG